GAADRCAPERLDLHQAFGGKALERLAHFQPATAGLADDINFHQPLLRRELTAPDPFANPVRYLDAGRRLSARKSRAHARLPSAENPRARRLSTKSSVIFRLLQTGLRHHTVKKRGEVSGGEVGSPARDAPGGR